MTSSRLVACIAAVVALVGGPAAAERPRACNLVTDAEGDAAPPTVPDGGWPTGTPAYPSSLDIVTADVATDATRLTAVIRVAGLRSDETGSPSGIAFAFHLTVRGQRFSLEASRNVGSEPRFRLWGRVEHVGDENSGAASYGLIGPIDGVFDEDASEIRMTAPLRLFGSQIRAGERFGAFRLWSYFEAGATSPASDRATQTGHSADGAQSAATYAAGSPSCVRVGY